jgi:hypothetical protein
MSTVIKVDIYGSVDLNTALRITFRRAYGDLASGGRLPGKGSPDGVLSPCPIHWQIELLPAIRPYFIGIKYELLALHNPAVGLRQSGQISGKA